MNRVLWVDDEAGFTLAPLGRLLRRRGLLIDIAQNVATALDLLERREYDAVLVDLLLPSGHGSGSLEIFGGFKILEYLKKRATTSPERPRPRVAVLSVVSRNEISARLAGYEVAYFEKLELVDKSALEKLQDVLGLEGRG